MAWACSQCPKRKSEELHPYTVKLLRLRSLQAGGYPLAANDLTLEEWLDLGQIKRALEPPLTCPLMTGKAE